MSQIEFYFASFLSLLWIPKKIVLEWTPKYWTSNTPNIGCPNIELYEHHILAQIRTSNMSNITKNWTVCEHRTVCSKTIQDHLSFVYVLKKRICLFLQQRTEILYYFSWDFLGETKKSTLSRKKAFYWQMKTAEKRILIYNTQEEIRS